MPHISIPTQSCLSINACKLGSIFVFVNTVPVLSVNHKLQTGFQLCFFCNSIHTQGLIYCDALISLSYFTQHKYELAADVWRCTYNIYPPHNPVIGARLVSWKIILHKLVFISDSLCKLTQTSFLHFGCKWLSVNKTMV